MPKTGETSTDEQIVVDLSETRFEKPCLPFRYFVMLMIFMCTVITYSVKSVINVAILAMVSDSTDPHQNDFHGFLEIFTASNKSKTFAWNAYDQAMVLGGYFYSYTAVQLVSGAITDKLSIVRVLAVSQVIAALSTIATPFAASINVYCLVSTRALIGLSHGFAIPALLNLIERWFPPAEKAFAQSLISVGCNFGIAVTMPITAWLCASDLWGGWPSAFIIIGIANLCYAVVLTVTLSDRPQSNPLATRAEKLYLAGLVVNKQSTESSQDGIPWLKLFTSLPLWSVFLVRGLIGIAYYTVNTKIPLYLESILHFNIKNNGLINASFYIAICTAQLMSGSLAKLIILKGWLSKTATRKIFETITVSGLTIGLIVIPYFGENSNLIVLTLILAMFTNGFDTGADVPIIPEMAPKYVGTAFGFTNTLRCAAGFIAPALIGFILGDDTTSESKWFFTFHIIAGLQFIGLSSFLIFATAEPLTWAIDKQS